METKTKPVRINLDLHKIVKKIVHALQDQDKKVTVKSWIEDALNEKIERDKK